MAAKNYSIKTRNLVMKPLSLEEMKTLVALVDEERRSVFAPIVEECSTMEAEEYFWCCLWEMKDRKSGENRGWFRFDGPVENYEEKVEFFFEDRTVLKEALVEICNTVLYGDHGAYYVLCEAKDDEYAKILEGNGFEHIEGSDVLEYAKPEHSMLSMGISLGIIWGVALGTAFGNMASGIGVGMALGVAFGLFMDSSSKKKWAAVKENRTR